MNIIQVYKQFPTQLDCIAHLEKVRWHGAPVCPYCKSMKSTAMADGRHHCNTCNTSYSVTVGTIFHKTKTDLQKWFLAISLMLNAKKGISARQLARDIEVNKNTAWYMAMRVREAMIEQRELLEGVVEIDETYVGGKGPKGGKRGRGTPNKTPVVGVIQRGGKIRAQTVRDVTAKTLSCIVRENVRIESATVMSDSFSGYAKLSGFIDHKQVNHNLTWTIGDIHTNTIEGVLVASKARGGRTIPQSQCGSPAKVC